jgi:hypothetical protein
MEGVGRRGALALACSIVACGVLATGNACAAVTPVTPANGASVQAGTPIQFQVQDSGGALDGDVYVSSSPATKGDGTLSTADVATEVVFFTNGSGSVSWTPSNTAPQTVYWQATAFECPISGPTCGTVAGPVESLTITPMPPPQPTAPANGATVTTGASITFSATDSTDPELMYTEISSSPATKSDGTLANPIGLENIMLGTNGSYTYSTTAPDTAGTYYWIAYREGCSVAVVCSFTPVASAVQTLIVANPPPAPPPPVHVQLDGDYEFHINSPTLKWYIECNVDCQGSTYYSAYVVHRGRTTYISSLDPAGGDFNLTNADTDVEVFHYTYRGSALHRLQRLVAADGSVRFSLHVDVSDEAGNTSSSDQRTLYMYKPGPKTYYCASVIDPILRAVNITARGTSCGMGRRVASFEMQDLNCASGETCPILGFSCTGTNVANGQYPTDTNYDCTRGDGAEITFDEVIPANTTRHSQNRPPGIGRLASELEPSRSFASSRAAHARGRP